MENQRYTSATPPRETQEIPYPELKTQIRSNEGLGVRQIK